MISILLYLLILKYTNLFKPFIECVYANASNDYKQFAWQKSERNTYRQKDVLKSPHLNLNGSVLKVAINKVCLH